MKSSEPKSLKHVGDEPVFNTCGDPTNCPTVRAAAAHDDDDDDDGERFNP